MVLPQPPLIPSTSEKGPVNVSVLKCDATTTESISLATFGESASTVTVCFTGMDFFLQAAMFSMIRLHNNRWVTFIVVVCSITHNLQKILHVNGARYHHAPFFPPVVTIVNHLSKDHPLSKSFCPCG